MDNNDEDKMEQDPVQRSIDERLEKVRYRTTSREKEPHKYEKLQTVLAVVMALGIVAGLLAIIIQFFIK